ncbi:MAG: acetyltransferase [Sphingomonas bacterium]|uniref:GNAT family N-acetyltransferase n=1 Tax=Sphingomonas bacterium TaxID=1895847 RepID=UPI0026087351|nr:GNAT family N-acetyltransferase [Sphingomonas bacterium]MDB5707707.1 acetyltransferase [Sphingomonas bacterium]
MTAEAERIAHAYRWQRALGNRLIETPGCRIVANPDLPEIWDANHADAVTAASDAEIEAVLAAMERHLAHSNWRVVHSDRFTPDAFLARLALDGYVERPSVVQMALRGRLTRATHPIDLRPVKSDADWTALATLVRTDHDEGARTGGLDLDPSVTDATVAGYRAKGEAYRFHFVLRDGAPVAYGARIVAPDGIGMIEDLFTLPAWRRQGIASGMIAAFVEDLRARGCATIFLGALAQESAKDLYAALGFRPVMLARTWVKAARKGA